jgi:hypothetical protein
VGSGDGDDRCAEYGDLGLACVLGFRGEERPREKAGKGDDEDEGARGKKWMGGARALCGFPTVKNGERL